MKRQAEATLPTPFGRFSMLAYSEDPNDRMPHVVLISETMKPGRPAYVRIHSECMTGDIFGSFRCDCGEQLDTALRLVAEKGGMVIYLRQEGRGIGIVNKLKAYNLQDEGLNTVEANTHLGFEADERIYNDALEILRDLDVRQLHLLTNNPDKVRAFEKGSDIEVLSRVPLVIPPRAENKGYYETKKNILGHALE